MEKGPIDFNLALQWFLQIIHAINFLHQCGLLHRDLKPENIMIFNGNAYLIDFDFAMRIGTIPNTNCAD